MATCSVILLSILKTAGSLVSELEEAHFMSGCLRFIKQYVPGLLLMWMCARRVGMLRRCGGERGGCMHVQHAER